MKELEAIKKTIMVGNKKQKFIVIKPSAKSVPPQKQVYLYSNSSPQPQSARSSLRGLPIKSATKASVKRKPCGGCSRRRAKKDKRE